MRFLDGFFDIKMHWTTLQKAAKRLPKSLWQALLAATISSKLVHLAAADGTGFSRTNPSHYFLKRIDRDGPVGRPVQAVALVDVQKRKFLSVNFYAKPSHEAKRIPYLHSKSPVKPNTILMDKGFDAEWLHRWLNENGTYSVAPARKNCRRGFHRKQMRDYFDWGLYWQRNIVESLFSAIKRLFGSSVRSRTMKTQTAELFCRLIAYNLGYRLRLFLQSRNNGFRGKILALGIYKRVLRFQNGFRQYALKPLLNSMCCGTHKNTPLGFNFTTLGWLKSESFI
jgi:transposase